MTALYEDTLREAYAEEALPGPLDSRIVVAAARRRRTSRLVVAGAVLGATAVLAVAVVVSTPIRPMVAGMPKATTTPIASPADSAATIAATTYVPVAGPNSSLSTKTAPPGTPEVSLLPVGSAESVGPNDLGVLVWSANGLAFGFVRASGGWSLVEVRDGVVLATVVTYAPSDFVSGAPKVVVVPDGAKRVVLIVAPKDSAISLGRASSPNDSRSYQVDVVSLDDWTAMATTVDPGEVLFMANGTSLAPGYVIPIS